MREKKIKGLNFFRQGKRPICVPSSLATVLNRLGIDADPDGLKKELKTKILGTDLVILLNTLVRRGFFVYPFLDSAGAVGPFLDKDLPLLIWFCGEAEMHTCVVFGYREEEGRVTHLWVHDPSRGEKLYSVDEINGMGMCDKFQKNCFYLLVSNEELRGELSEYIEHNFFYQNMMGEIYFFGLNKREEARRYWEKALRLRENYAEAYNNLAIYYMEQKNYGRALELAVCACEIDSDELTFMLTRAEIYLRQKEEKLFFQMMNTISEKWKRNIDVLKLKRRGENVFGKSNRIL